MKTRVSSISTLQERILLRNPAHLVFSSCWVQVWPDQFYSLTNTRTQHILFCVPSHGFSPILYYCIINGHSERNEKKMRRRRVGGGERGMSRPSGPCICSTAAPAVNSHDRHTNTGTSGNKHTLTYTVSFLWVRYTSADPPWIKSPASSAYVSLQLLFQYDEENPTGPALCCSLRCAACLRGRVRGRERGEGGGGARVREDLSCSSGTCVMRQSWPRPLLDAANRWKAEICLTTDCR